MLEQLFSPQAVAILGASRNPGKVGHAFVANLLATCLVAAAVLAGLAWWLGPTFLTRS